MKAPAWDAVLRHLAKRRGRVHNLRAAYGASRWVCAESRGSMF